MLSRLYTLLLVLVVAWSSWAVFGPPGAVVCAFICALALCLSRSWPLTYFFVVVVLLLLLIAMLLPSVQASREASPRVACINNLKQISLAVLCYESQYRCFPPPYVADENGKPMHSWRVLILPFMELRELYDKYNFSEPWDGPNNRKLLAVRPKVYTCPIDASALKEGATTTSYVAVVGSNAAWHRGKRISLNARELAGHTADTILLIESSDSGIQWTEPRDFSLDDLQSAAAKASTTVIRAPHTRSNGYFFHDTPTGANVAFVDGHESSLPAANLSAQSLKQLLTIGGCKDENFLPPDGSDDLRLNWPNCIVLAIWIASVGLLLRQAVRSRKARRGVANSCS
jgi:prepilin-type processing-associated H-X9-DG protein